MAEVEHISKYVISVTEDEYNDVLYALKQVRHEAIDYEELYSKLLASMAH